MSIGSISTYFSGRAQQTAALYGKNPAIQKSNTPAPQMSSTDTISLSGAHQAGSGIRFSGHREGNDYVHSDGRREVGYFRSSGQRNEQRGRNTRTSTSNKNGDKKSSGGLLGGLFSFGKEAAEKFAASQAQDGLEAAASFVAPQNRHTHSLKKSYAPMPQGSEPPADARYAGDRDKQRYYNDDTYAPKTIPGVHPDHVNLGLTGFETDSASSNDGGYSRHDKTLYGPDGQPTGLTELDSKKSTKRHRRISQSGAEA